MVGGGGERDLHECIIDGDHKDLSGAGELGVGNETRNMGVRASWALMRLVYELELVKPLLDDR